MQRRLMLLLIAALLPALGVVAGCGSGGGGKSADPAAADSRAAEPAASHRSADTDGPGAGRPEPIARRRPPRRRAPQLRPGDRPIYVELSLEGRRAACDIDGRRIAILPEERARVVAYLAETDRDPEHTVAVLAIDPYVRQSIVSALIADLTHAGIKRMVFAAAAPRRRR